MASQRALLPEILIEILSCLSTPDLTSCALVNRPWSWEATRLLWCSIKFDASIHYLQDIDPAIGRFIGFIKTLTMEAKRSSNVRRLAIKIDSTIPDQESSSIIETPETFLTVSWMSINNAFNRMYRLRSLELRLPFFLSRRTVASICEALSGSPICSIHSRVDIRDAFKEYGVWGSSITNLVLQGVEVFPELPDLPNLRFIACDNIDVITGLIPSSPLESICSHWGYSSESALTRLMATISRQAGTGLSTLRNIYVKQYIHPNTVLWGFLGSLECPTLEHIHLVLSGSEWFEPHSMIDHVPICLDAAPLSISQRLPALRSLRLELYDSNLFTVPPELKRSEIPSSTLETEAASRLSLWLHQNYYPPLLKHIQIYGKGTSRGPLTGCMMINIEAKRPVTLPGGLTKSSDPDFWEVTDSVENIFLPEPWSIYSSGFYPPFVVSDPTALPLVPNPDGVIRWSRAPLYTLWNGDDLRMFPLPKGLIPAVWPEHYMG